MLYTSHFLKEELPRIRWANPTLDIEVEKVPKTIKEAWKPELELRFSTFFTIYICANTLTNSTCGSQRTGTDP